MSSTSELPQPTNALAGCLLPWFETEGRCFPWRNTRVPYSILVAEIMLQRTRAAQVVPVYTEFVAAGLTPADVVSRGPRFADGLFGQLGLAWRARFFYSMNVILAENHGNQVPASRTLLKQLPGVGDYVATAVMVFAHGHRLTVVDSNVLRVFRRYFGREFPDHMRRSNRFLQWASQLCPVDPDDARRFNWALLDLGADICTPSDYRRAQCPLSQDCVAYRRANE